jgi:hypothetical protein
MNAKTTLLAVATILISMPALFGQSSANQTDAVSASLNQNISLVSNSEPIEKATAEKKPVVFRKEALLRDQNAHLASLEAAKLNAIKGMDGSTSKDQLAETRAFLEKPVTVNDLGAAPKTGQKVSHRKSVVVGADGKVEVKSSTVILNTFSASEVLIPIFPLLQASERRIIPRNSNAYNFNDLHGTNFVAAFGIFTSMEAAQARQQKLSSQIKLVIHQNTVNGMFYLMFPMTDQMTKKDFDAMISKLNNVPFEYYFFNLSK